MSPAVCTNRAACLLRPLSLSSTSALASSSSPSLNSSSSTGSTSTRVRHASTVPLRQTKQRALMWAWLNGAGAVFREPRTGSTNYLGAYDRFGRLIRQQDADGQDQGGKAEAKKDDGAEAETKDDASKPSTVQESETLEDLRPFPLNPYFRSQSVLSDELKDEIFRRVVQQKKTVREVSQSLHVEMRRVAAVVRLKTVEQQWVKEDKPLAKVYSRAVTAMLPSTPYVSGPGARQPRHESINDLPVHEATLPQVFHPAPESRHFTRADAGRAFHRALLPADARIPHPDMIEAARDALEGMPQGERSQRQKQRIEQDAAARLRRAAALEERQRQGRRVVAGKRWDFVFGELDSEANAGRDGRAGRVGWRYGVPLADRKKGQVKIPTSVE